MKGLFIYFDFIRDDESGNSVGIIKKIRSQYECFKRNLGDDCTLLNLPRVFSRNSPFLLFSFLFSKWTFDISSVSEERYDYVYIRRIDPNCKSIIYLLRLLRERNPKCRIVYEIPTYPYDYIYKKDFLGKVKLFVDKLYRKKLKNYIDRIATLTDDEEVFNCKTLRITNGIDYTSIEISKKKRYNPNELNLISVAQFGFYHGVERVIVGLLKYSGRKIFLHIVGDGYELGKYKKIVKKHHLEDQVKFYGPLFADELSEVFDISDVALCPLAAHRMKVFTSSALKSREYLCRGLPIVTSTAIDIISDGFKYCMRVPEDESPINIGEIVDFADSIYGSKAKEDVTAEIRSFAERTCGMDVSMKSVLDFFKEGRSIEECILSS